MGVDTPHASRAAWYALAGYIVLAVAGTWPLTRGLGRDVAWDLGDSLLNMWILAWDCEQILRILGGELGRILTFFDANIFYPAPLTLAYSEHLLAQAIQVLPIYALTGNPILCYNLLFLSTIVLSALGMFLLVRQLTGSALAGFVAGVLFAFAPYRIAQSSHLQVLSAQWMPFVLYGVRRYFDDRRLAPLLWAGGALVLQNLSCGYYLLFFAPFAAAYVLWELASRGLWRERRVWTHLLLAAAIVVAFTAPLLLPYARVHELLQMGRTLTEVTRLAADVHSYATASAAQPLWGGRVNAYPKSEGELFPGFVAVLLALVGVFFRLKGEATKLKPEATGVIRAFRLQAEGWRRAASILLALLAIVHVLLAFVTLLERRVVLELGLFALRMSDVTQLLLRATIAFALLLALSPSARRRSAAFMRDRGFFVVALVAAAWLSLGPSPRSFGRPVDLIGPYGWLYEYVPGFEGVRVPARFGMIVALMLAILGGYGAAALSRWKTGRPLVAALAAAFLLEGTALPFLVNGATPPAGFVAPEARVYRPARAPRLYHTIAALDPDVVVAELPLGHPDFDLRATYYSMVHWRRILNGYSGFYPPFYGSLATALSNIPRRVDDAMLTLKGAGVTHVLVHEGAFLDNEGPEISRALVTAGAVEVDREGSDVLIALPR